ncbi:MULTISPECIES: hypothetical protein [unclassified Beijerinckia]|uniref:hypothetical protein n=1 Tax=unclassified Beijerinckia TaxID=2638183 RepID=UPI000897C6B2|nr:MULTISPECIES: hypothetical protein [unclassified Beijerinckia]MDH7795769.1 hypothetical protein [Beijerinckia sp. GAS462]SEC15456.1 hypothetical protein SAMN05443249_2046 [Beijerinckia sp. 28-YEA-48]
MKLLSGLLLAAALTQLAPAFAQAPKKAVASPALQQEFDGFIAKFRAALKANDSTAVAGMTRLPFEESRDIAQFRAKAYPANFTSKNRTCLQRGKTVYDRDQLNNDNYFIFCGNSIFVFTKTPSGFLFTDVGAND